MLEEMPHVWYTEETQTRISLGFDGWKEAQIQVSKSGGQCSQKFLPVT